MEALRRKLEQADVRSRVGLRELHDVMVSVVRELDGTERALLLHEIATRVAKQNPAAGLELLADLPEFRDRHAFASAMLETTVADDPLGAAAWVARITDPVLQESAYNVLAMKWAESNLSAARDWALTLSSPGARLAAIEGIAWAAAQNDLPAAYAWAAALESPELREHVFTKMAKLLATQNPQRALEWAVQFPAGAARDQALHYAMFQWAGIDLGGAAEWTRRLQDPVLQNQSEVAIARSWSNQEAQGATTWAAQIRDPEARTAALKSTLSAWAGTHPAEAARWIAENGPTVSDDIFHSVTAALIDQKPTAAVTWVDTVTNPDWRATGERMLAEKRTKLPLPKRS
jgi:hypothetical protein